MLSKTCSLQSSLQFRQLLYLLEALTLQPYTLSSDTRCQNLLKKGIEAAEKRADEYASVLEEAISTSVRSQK